MSRHIDLHPNLRNRIIWALTSPHLIHFTLLGRRRTNVRLPPLCQRCIDYLDQAPQA